MTAFAVLGTWHAPNSLQENLARYARQPAEASLTLDTWHSEGWQNIPTYRTDLVGETEEPLIVQWAGDADQLAAILSNAGWLAARPRSTKDALQFLNPAATLTAPPPLPLLNDGRFPVLTMIQLIPLDNERRLVFRAWSSQTVLSAGAARTPLFVGSITFEEMTHPFGLMTTLHDQKPPNFATLALASALRADLAIYTTAPKISGVHPGPILAYPKAVPFASPKPLNQMNPSPKPAQTAPSATEVKP